MAKPEPVSKLRVCRGELKGRSLAFREAEGLRPTANRVREAVFSMLADFADSHGFVDVFAGSGIMALDAYSMGFRPVFWLESHQATASGIERGLASLNVDAAVFKGDATAWPGPPQPSLLVAYCDPPFDKPHLYQKLMDRFASADWCLPGSLVVLEFEVPHPPAEHKHMALIKTKRYGRCRIAVFEKLAQTS